MRAGNESRRLRPASFKPAAAGDGPRRESGIINGHFTMPVKKSMRSKEPKQGDAPASLEVGAVHGGPDAVSNVSKQLTDAEKRAARSIARAVRNSSGMEPDDARRRSSRLAQSAGDRDTAPMDGAGADSNDAEGSEKATVASQNVGGISQKDGRHGAPSNNSNVASDADDGDIADEGDDKTQGRGIGFSEHKGAGSETDKWSSHSATYEPWGQGAQ